MNKRMYMPVILFAGTVLVGCVDSHLPESLDYFDIESNFTQTAYEPKLGRTELMTNNFNSSNSTIPLTFEIVNMRHADGTPAPELTQTYPVVVWKKPYLGTETSAAEIEAKRGIENRTLFQVRKHSGEFIMWSEAHAGIVRCQPDAGYIFDVVARNSGGYEYSTSMTLKPIREDDYLPSLIDSETGLQTKEYSVPTAVGNIKRYDESGQYTYTYSKEDIHIYFHRNIDTEKDGSVHTLTFRFLDENFQPISPKKFNQTKWEQLVHGFNCRITDEAVSYDVVYPIPLFTMKTQYTNKDGDMATVSFLYDRVNRYGVREDSSLSFDFAIYKEGNWEISFVFTGGTPVFDSEK